MRRIREIRSTPGDEVLDALGTQIAEALGDTGDPECWRTYCELAQHGQLDPDRLADKVSHGLEPGAEKPAAVARKGLPRLAKKKPVVGSLGEDTPTTGPQRSDPASWSSVHGGEPHVN